MRMEQRMDLIELAAHVGQNPGRRSEVGLYAQALATYETADRFGDQDVEGLVRPWGLAAQTWPARRVNDKP